MKKFVYSVVLFQVVFTTSFSQNLLSKVPVSATMIMKYTGENLSKKMPVNQADTYGFIKNNLLKAFKTDSLLSISEIGIDFEKDSYQYLDANDSITNFVTMFHLKNTALFLKLVEASGPKQKIADKKMGYSFLPISDNSYLGWNNEIAVMVNTTYKNYARDYYAAVSDVKVAEDAAMAVDSAVASVNMEGSIEQTPVEAEAPVAPVKKGQAKVGVKKKAGGTVAANKKKSAGKPLPKIKRVETVVDEEELMRIKDSVETAKIDEWYQQQEIIKIGIQQAIADSIINAGFNKVTAISLETDSSYMQVIDNTADISMLLDYETLLSKYGSMFYGGVSKAFPFSKFESTTVGFKSGINLYFEKDKVKLVQKVFSHDKDLTALSKKMFDNKQNPSFINYVNPDNIAYFSMSVNTEAMENYYYRMLKKYIGNISYAKEYADLVDVYIDLLEIVIDEKAIAELMPGNVLLVLHNLNSKTVTYKDYDYDNDFNRTEIEKTKTELAPDFSFVMETRNEQFLQKLVNLPVKYAKKEKFDYEKTGDYYVLSFDPKKFPVEHLYFMVKNGRLIITTSKECIDFTFRNSGYPTDEATKNSILNNNYSAKVNSKKLIEGISKEFTSGTNKKIIDYLQENMGDLTMESRLIDGLPQSTATFNVSGNYTNSLEYLFNMIDAINNIIEKDKQANSETEKPLQ
jgi:hypothetical protein